MAPITITMTFAASDWATIDTALYDKAGELAAFEARRTGGRGYGSGGIAGHVADLHRIQDEIRNALKSQTA